jgi:hypothetical protein
MLVAKLAGIAVGGVFVTWLGKRYKDANIRATPTSSPCATVCAILAPLSRAAKLAIAFGASSSMFGPRGRAGAESLRSNVVAPNEMRAR